MLQCERLRQPREVIRAEKHHKHVTDSTAEIPCLLPSDFPGVTTGDTRHFLKNLIDSKQRNECATVEF